MNPHKLKISLLIVVGLIAIVLGVVYWRYSVAHPETDNAYVNANIINIGTQVSGPVSQIYVTNEQRVKKGDPLFDILATPYQAALDQATAQLQQAQNTIKRTEKLLKHGYAAQSSLDDAKAALAVAEASVAQAQLNLGFTHVLAPASGSLINFNLRVGTTIAAGLGITLFSIIEDQGWWVDANYKETQLDRIKIGQHATIVLDVYPNKTFHGAVTALSDGSGSAFSLLPATNASGNWVKVTQRFPVKIVIADPDPAYPLRVGASATVVVDTTS